jgi:hypothetical protein
MNRAEKSQVSSQPYCWVSDGNSQRLTPRQARAIAASDHCTESAYIHPVGDPETKLTSRADVDAYEQGTTNGQRDG